MSEINPERLWAKSKRVDEPFLPSMLLSGHLQDVYYAAERILDATGDLQLAALGLEPNKFRNRLRRCVLLAAAIHDLGKANNHFQGMITRQRNIQQNPQGLRHEWVTLLMLKSLKEWLLPAINGSETDFAIIEWAVAGHHPAHRHCSPPKHCPPGAGTEIEVQLGHPDIHAVLLDIAHAFKLSAPDRALPCHTAKYSLIASDSIFLELSKWAKSARRIWNNEICKTSDRQFVAAVKSCLIAADIAGSALPKAEPNDPINWEWITQSLDHKPESGDLQRVADFRLNGSLPREFQLNVAESASPLTYVKAGCGSGKTVAAYLWAARNHPIRRLYFCYPTTGTATEGFKDYLYEPDGELGNLGARLFHSRRDIDFEVILGTGGDSDFPVKDAVAKLESLEAWSTPVVACTVDTVLGLIQNNKRGLFAWPALAQSAFVFDEIHCFDDRLFGALLRFIRDLPGLPVLLMTASLPRAREDALREILGRYRNIELAPIEGPPELERLPRYHKISMETADPLSIIRKELQDGGKVLWVCNTVGRVMDAAKRAEKMELKPLIYHSRFKYVDRVERHKAVVEAFTPECKNSTLAICSQVAEMSLDLKGCTLLATELAPVPALIQRLGRLNRQAKRGDSTRPFVVVEPDNHLPYTPADLDAARSWLMALPETDITQRDLADKWEQAGDQPPDLVSSAWLDGGPTTSVRELREASPGITVLMREDVTRSMKSKDLARYLIPMPPPKALDWHSWSRHKGVPIAEPETIFYNKMRGAEWVK